MKIIPFTHTIEGGRHDGLTLEVEAEFVHDSGVHIEAGHPWNGYNSGWYCERLTARDERGHMVAVSDDLYEVLQQHALKLLDSR